jgi:hypothetical protein
MVELLTLLELHLLRAPAMGLSSPLLPARSMKYSFVLLTRLAVLAPFRCLPVHSRLLSVRVLARSR